MSTESTKVESEIDACVSKKVENDDDQKSPLIDINHNHQSNTNSNANGDKSEKEKNQDDESDDDSEERQTFKPKVNLPLVNVPTLEESEDVLLELRARIYRYETKEDEEPEFKERGTGQVKILRHRQTNMYRILMRRDKTFKICANHYITGAMKLSPHNNSDKVFIYSTLADFYENETTPETFAIRFSNSENALKFKNCFDDAVKDCSSQICNLSSSSIKSNEENDEEEEITNNNVEEADEKSSKEISELTSEIKKIEINENNSEIAA